jgi:hypothetical protein
MEACEMTEPRHIDQNWKPVGFIATRASPEELTQVILAVEPHCQFQLHPLEAREGDDRDWYEVRLSARMYPLDHANRAWHRLIRRALVGAWHPPDARTVHISVN